MRSEGVAGREKIDRMQCKSETNPDWVKSWGGMQSKRRAKNEGWGKVKGGDEEAELNQEQYCG